MHTIGTQLRVIRGNGQYLQTGDTVKVLKVVEQGSDRHGPCRGYVVSNPRGRSKHYIWDENRFAKGLAKPGDMLKVSNGNGKYLRTGDSVKVLATVDKGHDHTGPVTGYITTTPRGKAKPYIWNAERFA